MKKRPRKNILFAPNFPLESFFVVPIINPIETTRVSSTGGESPQALEAKSDYLRSQR